MGGKMKEKEAMLAEIKRIKASNRQLKADIRSLKRESEQGNIELDVSKDPDFREHLARVILAMEKGFVTDRVLVDPVRGKIHATGSEPSREVMWRLVPATDLIDPDLDVINSDIELITSSILNRIIIEVSKL